MLQPESLYLTGNTSTLYSLGYVDLKKEGPLVLELPPGMLGFVDDAWFRFVENLGAIGPDKGKGGKYLLLPPDHQGDVPEGYFVVKSDTYSNLVFLRGSVAKGLEPAVENIKSNLKVYPLAQAENPLKLSLSTSPARATIRLHQMISAFSKASTPWFRKSRSTQSARSHGAFWPQLAL
ncbi:DUF1254 domain-containing protein [Falsihalocynthiibacter arcticus]|uniref:DUF1254 domain-containing protein n=1 Tax=Falsihalocynthiibacter arcticus TaxID=1579316 RepID=UPI003AAC61D0